MIKNPLTNARAANDEAWKQVLILYLQDFLQLLWPTAYQDIDWNQPHEFLEQELLALNIKAAIGKRHVDKLVKVFLKNGAEQWLLLHIEIQHTKDTDLAARMFTYFYRIYDRYKRDVASMAVLIDKDKTWRPHEYYKCMWECKTSRTHKLIKLIDFKPRIEEFRNSSNPFALIIAFQLAALETTPGDQSRLLTKLELFRALHKHGWSMQQSIDLYRFLDTILYLKPQLEIQYTETVQQIDREEEMQLMSGIERIGFNKGIHIGEERGIHVGEKLGEQTTLSWLLQDKFGDLPEHYQQQISQSTTEQIRIWLRRTLTSNTLADVFANPA